MDLSPLGAHTCQLGDPEKRTLAYRLLSTIAPVAVQGYFTPNAGQCYDVVAFVRYLLGANITPDQLKQRVSQDWAPLFNGAGHMWGGGIAIASGTAVVFRKRDGTPFHIAIAVGAQGANTTIVRSVNGNNLGAGWTPVGDCDLSQVLTPVPDQAGTYSFGPGEGDVCQIWLSAL